MSIEAIHYVMKTDIPDGIAKLVAFVIADYAHAETGHAWPKVETLARKCSQSVRTVQRKIRVLQDLGILRVEERHEATGRQRENLFVLYLPGVPRPAANDARAAGGPDPEPGRGDTQSPMPRPRRTGSVTPGGDSAVTPGGDTAVTPRGIHQKESTRGIHSEPSGSAPQGGPAPKDFRSDLRSRGVETLRDLTGWTTARAHARIGQWLSEARDDAGMVLAVIDEAVEAEPVDTSGWIAARLKRRKTEAADAVQARSSSPGDRPRTASAAQPRPPANGAIALFLRRMGASDVRRDPVRAAADLGPVIDHRGDGHVDPHVQQPAGRSSDGSTPEAHARVAGPRR